MNHEDFLGTLLGVERKPDETDEQLRARVKRVLARGNRGGSVHDIAAQLLEATPEAVTVAYRDETTRYEPSWWRRWFLREKPRVELRAYFIVIVRRTSFSVDGAQLAAERALQQARPAGVLARVEVLEQVGCL